MTEITLKDIMRIHAEITHEQYIEWQYIMMMGRDYRMCDPRIDDNNVEALAKLDELRAIRDGSELICKCNYDVCLLCDSQAIVKQLHKGSFVSYRITNEIKRIERNCSAK